jgi:hypothetical protein
VDRCEGSESRDATSAHFAALIGDRPLEELKALNFKPYFGQGRATIKFPAKVRRGSEDEKGGTEPTTEMVDFSTPVIQINRHHSKSASAILTRSIAVVQTCIAIIQEPWLVRGTTKGLGSCGKVLRANTVDKTRTCIIPRELMQPFYHSSVVVTLRLSN